MTLEEALEIAQGPPSFEERYIESFTTVLSSATVTAEIRVDALINRGIAHGMAELTELALTDLSEAIRQDPAYDRGYANRALVYSMAGNDVMALSDFGRAIDLNRSNTTAYFGRAQLLRRQGKIGDAVADVAVARALNPGNPHIEQLWERLLDES